MNNYFYRDLDVFLSILSKQVEHNRWPFLIQNVFVDLSISFRQIKHLKIGGIINNRNFDEITFSSFAIKN